MKNIIIFGNSHFSRAVHHYLTVDGGWQVSAFTVNEKYIENDTLLDLPVIPFESIEKTHPPSEYSMVTGVGYTKMNRVREKVYQLVKEKGYQLPNFIHPTTKLCKDTQIGDGCLIFDHNIIHPFLKIGNNVIVWSNNVLGHDSVVEDHCFISSKVVFGGFSNIGKRSLLGGGCVVAPNKSVGADCLIGSGAIILKDTEDGGVYQPSGTERSKVPSSKLRI